MIAIDVQGLNYTYPDGTRAIKNLNLQIKEHKRVAVLGANGSGKTTLLYHFNGLILPQDGQIRIFGEKVSKKNIKTIRQKVGLLFDNPDNQLFSTTVFNDVAFGPRNLGLDENTVLEKVQRAMELVNVIDLKDKTPYNLSLGQKKRVAIAGVLAMEPSLLLLDEPFSGLDPISLKHFLNILDDLFAKGTTQVISTHDVDIAYSWADEVIILDKGKILAEGGVELLQDARLMERACLGVPMLARVFHGTSFEPKTVQEANDFLLSVLYNNTVSARRSAK